MSSSLPLFTLRVSSVAPSGTNTADLHATARCRDGHEYAVKWGGPDGVAASEWLGQRLAAACQIATPASATIEDADGKLGFGSRWDASAKEWDTLTAAERQAAWRECADPMTSIIALDLFCGNVDRHLNNFLYVRVRSGGWAPLCIDFSKALFVRNFPEDQPWPMGACSTIGTQSALKTLNLWSAPTAVSTLSQLQEVSRPMIEHWLAELPPGWLTQPQIDRLAGWWGSEAYHTRLQRSFSLV